MKIAKYWEENSMKTKKKKSKSRKKEKIEKEAETEYRRKKILIKSTSSRKLVKFVNLKKNEVSWSLVSKKVNYEEMLQLEKLKIANDEFDFERCENEYLSLKKTINQEKRAWKSEETKKKH